MSEADRQKWNAKYEGGSHAASQPSAFLVSLAERLPKTGRALDVAGGAGRQGLWLASRGLEVCIVDISAAGLAIARERAAAGGFAIETMERDLETAGLPPGPWDVVVDTHYLERSLFTQLPSVLAPGGLFVMVHPTVTNLERHARPSRRFLLEPGELRGLVEGLEILQLDESWSAEGFHEARLLARKPPRASS